MNAVVKRPDGVSLWTILALATSKTLLSNRPPHPKKNIKI
jgi:hypothetical protein